ncbi:hypothetical protein Q1695_000453 [Nippostrongylus brasiliensis]|nr:hypothetical protein Q1695_000453 [Nippostrongylus brasiliensis]
MEEDDAPSGFDIKKQAFNEIETYLCGLKSNLLTIMKASDESSTEELLETAAWRKSKYHESSIKAQNQYVVAFVYCINFIFLLFH